MEVLCKIIRNKIGNLNFLTFVNDVLIIFIIYDHNKNGGSNYLIDNIIVNSLEKLLKITYRDNFLGILDRATECFAQHVKSPRIRLGQTFGFSLF